MQQNFPVSVTRDKHRVFFSLVSRGTTCEEWKASFKEKGYHLSPPFEQLLTSKEFMPTNGVPFHVEVVRGSHWMEGSRTNRYIQIDATQQNWHEPTVELCCLIRDTFSNEDLVLLGIPSIIFFYKQRVNAGYQQLGLKQAICINEETVGRLFYSSRPSQHWNSRHAFAFTTERVRL